MRHLGERIADYVFQELSTHEMAAAKSHVQECADCRNEVERFQRTHSLLKATPDVDPPRSIVFEFDRPAPNRLWRWLAPMTAAAVLLLAVAIAAPVQIRWADSQVTIAFGSAPETVPVAPVSVPATQVVEKVVADPVDYARIERWLADELNKRDAVRLKEIQRLQGQLAYLENIQLSHDRSILATESNIQLLASRGASGE